MPAVAITDHGNMFGAIRFYEKATKAGVKPLLGCEVYVARGGRKHREKGAGAQTDHLLLLASSTEGYRNLLSLVSTGYLEGFYYTPRIDKEVLEQHSAGLIALSGCLSGEVARLAASGNSKEAMNAAGRFQEIFGKGNFYIEIQNHGLREQLDLLPLLVDISGKTDIPLVATNDCHYLRREDSEAHDVLLCIQTGKSVEDPDRMRFNTDQVYFKSAEEMLETFADLPHACANSVEIAEKCNVTLEFGKMHLPRFPLPEGRTSAEGYLRELGEQGLDARYDEVTDEMRQRFEFEIETICQMGFAR
jgi:DNA polymerase-3 subunit alpha